MATDADLRARAAAQRVAQPLLAVSDIVAPRVEQARPKTSARPLRAAGRAAMDEPTRGRRAGGKSNGYTRRGASVGYPHRYRGFAAHPNCEGPARAHRAT
jgi:hypothetical protein